MTLYGFYSAQAAAMAKAEGRRPIKWSTPDGDIVTVTCVCGDPDGGAYLWSDKVCVGLVVDCVQAAPLPFSACGSPFLGVRPRVTRDPLIAEIGERAVRDLLGQDAPVSTQSEADQ